MKFVIGLIIVVGLSLGVYQIHEYWGNFSDKTPATGPRPRQWWKSAAINWAGLPPQLQGPLQEAEQGGARRR